MQCYLRRGAWTALAASLIFIFGSWGYAHRLTGPRQRHVGAPPPDFPYAIEPMRLTTSDRETLAGWYIPGEATRKAIVLLHGYTGDRTSMLPRARFLREQGYAVLLYDARACGESTGECVTFGYRERHDLTAALRFLREKGHDCIACLGVSQGGATIACAGHELGDVKCAICESAFDELGHAVERRMRRYTGLPGWLGGALLVPLAEHRLGLSIDDVKPSAGIATLPCPVLIISGSEDRSTLPDDTQRLFEAARHPKELWMIDGARHEDLFRFDGYRERVSAFLQRHMQ